MAKMSVSQCRQNYHSDSEANINRQINMELYASYSYHSMSLYFDRDDVALPGFANINRQINMELYASYSYHSMSLYFDRDDVALPGFAKYFEKASVEEREHAEKLMKYQNKRGGRIVLQDIKKPDRDEWGSGLEAMQVALQLEKSVNQSLLDIHKVASQHEDAQLSDYLESEFLDEQVEAIKQIGDHITQLKRVGPGMGEYLYDKESLSE